MWAARGPGSHLGERTRAQAATRQSRMAGANERSRARAARELEGTLQSRMVGAKHGPGDGEDDEAVMARPRKSIEKVQLCGIKSKNAIRTSASRPPAGISREIAILRSKKRSYIPLRAYFTAASACIVMVSKIGTLTSLCLINNGISVHPSMTPCTPSSSTRRLII